MAILKDNHLLAGLSGKLGNFVLKQVNGKTIMASAPKRSDKEATSQQVEQRRLFTEAVAYAKGISNDPEQKKLYAKKIKKGQSVYQYAVKEFFANKGSRR